MSTILEQLPMGVRRAVEIEQRKLDEAADQLAEERAIIAGVVMTHGLVGHSKAFEIADRIQYMTCMAALKRAEWHGLEMLEKHK